MNCKPMIEKLICQSQVKGGVDRPLDFIYSHHLAVLAYESLLGDPQYEPICNALKIGALQSALVNKRHYGESLKMIALLNQSQVPFCVVKGPIAAQSFKAVSQRYMGDLDIWIRPQDERAIREYLMHHGFRMLRDDPHDKHFEMSSDSPLVIEVHRKLFNGSKLEKSDIFEKQVWSDQVVVDLRSVSNDGKSGIAVSTISPIWHFRYSVFHILDHLKSDGIGFKQIIDLVMAAEYHKVDVLAQLPFFESMGYGLFYEALLRLCSDELQLSEFACGQVLRTYPWRVSGQVITALFEHMMASGSYGKGTEDHRSSLIYARFISDHTKISPMKVLLQSVFPLREEAMNPRFHYGLKHPILLPVAWIHRGLKSLARRDITVKTKFTYFTSGKYGSTRKGYFNHLLCADLPHEPESGVHGQVQGRSDPSRHDNEVS